MKIFFGYIFCLLIVFGAISVITVLQNALHFNVEVSRKIIHILVGFTWLPMYFFLRDTVHYIIIPTLFIIVNALSNKYNVFKAIEREPDNGKNNLGTVYYAICMTIMSIVCYVFPEMNTSYGVSVAVLSFGDGAAALLGSQIKNHNYNICKNRSLIGTLSCFVFSIIGVLLLKIVIDIQLSFLQILLISLAAAIFEFFGGKFDNFVISFGTLFLSSFFLGVI